MSIAILPIGEVDPGIVEELKASLSKLFRPPLIVCNAMAVPESAFYRDPGKYLATDIIDEVLKNEEYLVYEKILSLFEGDIFMLDIDFDFVYGEAKGRVALISLAHLRETLSLDNPEDKVLFMKRILTESLHELGHIYGLGHCRLRTCVMYSFESLKETDRLPEPRFCERCSGRLRETREVLV